MINPDNNAAIDGKSLETLRQRSAEVNGNVVIETDKQVNHGANITAPAFGLLESAVYNEKNSNKSRQKERRIDVNNLVTATDKAHQGLESMGADSLTITRDYVELPAAVPSSGHLIVESEVSFVDAKNGIKTTKTVNSWQPRVNKNQADPEADGAATTLTKQVVTAATSWPARTLNTLSVTRTQIGNDKFLQAVKVLDSARTPLVSTEEEATTGKRVTTTRTIHDTEPIFNVDGTARFITSVKQAGKDRWVKTVREIDASILTTTFQEYHPIEYYFPAYLDEDTPFLVFEAGEDQTLINTLRSSSQRLRVPCLFEITYHATLPTLSSIFQFKPVDIALRTPDGVINEQSVLTDGAVVTFRLKPTNQSLQNVTNLFTSGNLTYQQYIARALGSDVSFEFPASSPTTTAYKALMNTVVLIADDMMRWKYNLYRRVKIWMRIPDLATSLDGSISYS